MLTPDSIVPNPANPQSFNRFSYVLNSPLNYHDPSGHLSCNNNNLAEEDREECYIPSGSLVDALVNESVNLINGNFSVDRSNLRENIIAVMVAGAKYDLTSEETAYVLATAFGETRFGAQQEPGYFDDLIENIPIREAEENYFFDATKRIELGNMIEGDGWKYRGRGFSQLTGRANYQRMQNQFGSQYGVNIVDDPDMVATNLELSAEITVYGMVNGSFTSYSFSDAKESGDFFYNSRQIINGLTNATDYKRYAERYHNVLTTNYGTP